MIPLASNENPLGMPESARHAAAEALGGSALYPDGSGSELKAALAARLAVPADWVTLGSGSCEILTLSAQACVLPGQGVVWSQYGFLVYGQAAALVGARRSVVPALDFGHDLDAMRAAVDADTRLVFVANPNNPTGNLLDPGRLHAFIADLPAHVTVLLDEAYTEYLAPAQRYDSMAWVRQHPNLIVARTFSKAYGLAGLRIGYGVAQAALSLKLNAVRPRFNVTTPAMAAARAALDDSDFQQRTYMLNLAVRAALAEGLAALGLTVRPSAGNFLMVQFPDAPAMHAHLRGQGIDVSALVPYGLASWLRITTGLPEHNEALLAAVASGLQRS
jgi:histidinol-phosphate aminotransferase